MQLVLEHAGVRAVGITKSLFVGPRVLGLEYCTPHPISQGRDFRFGLRADINYAAAGILLLTIRNAAVHTDS